MTDWINQIYHLTEPYLPLLVSLSLGMMLVSFILLPAIFVILPADYFVHRRSNITHPFLKLLWLILRNLLAFVLLVLGILMLFLPGQGLLTILVALFFADFPGKRKLEIQLIKRPAVYKSINWIRHKANKPALELPE